MHVESIDGKSLPNMASYTHLYVMFRTTTFCLQNGVSITEGYLKDIIMQRKKSKAHKIFRPVLQPRVQLNLSS